MYYRLFDSEEEAKEYSHQEALNRGCDGVYTKYWWGWIVHPETGEAALQASEPPIIGYEEVTLEDGTTTDVAQIDPEWVDFLESGWFPTLDEDLI